MMVWPHTMGVAAPAGGGSYSSGSPMQECPDSCAYSQAAPAPPAQLPPPIFVCPHPLGLGEVAPCETVPVPGASRHTLHDESQLLVCAVTLKVLSQTLPLVTARNRSAPCFRMLLICDCCATVGVKPTGHPARAKRSLGFCRSWWSAKWPAPWKE